MITTKKDLEEYLECDRRSLGRKNSKPVFSDVIWRFEILLRKYEYYYNNNSVFKYLYGILFRRESQRLGFTIPINVCDKGLAIVHYGTIVISDGAKIGENCRIHEGVCIGATNGEAQAATIGKNVFIGCNSLILKGTVIGDNCVVGAGSVVSGKFEENCIIAGNPAKVIKKLV